MHSKDAYTSILEGVLNGKMKHSVLNNTVHDYKIDYADADAFYDLVMKLVRKVRNEAIRDV